MSDSDPVLPRPRRRVRDPPRKKGLDGNQVTTLAQKAKDVEHIIPRTRKFKWAQKSLVGNQVIPAAQKANEAVHVNKVPRTDKNATEAEDVKQVTTTSPKPIEAVQVDQTTTMDKNGKAAHLSHVTTTNQRTEAAEDNDDATISADSSEEAVQANAVPTTDKETEEAVHVNPLTITRAQIVLMTFLPNQPPVFWIREPSQLSGQAGDDGRLFRTSVQNLVNEPWRVELLRHLLSGGRPNFDLKREDFADDPHVFPHRLKDITRDRDTRGTDNESLEFLADLKQKLDTMYGELGGEPEEDLRLEKRPENPSADGYREFLADLGLWLPSTAPDEPDPPVLDRGFWFREPEPESE